MAVPRSNRSSTRSIDERGRHQPADSSPVGALLGRLPQLPPSAALAAAINLGALARMEPEALERLRGRIVRIVVRDARLRLTLSFDGRRFRPRTDALPADVTIEADTYDFGLLALRKEDPNTLFFTRRLSMQGNTELGLLVRNILDALDTPALAQPLERPLAILRSLRSRLPSR